MPLPVIANVWRVTFEMNASAGVAPRNVMHFLDAGGTRNAHNVFDTINGALAGTECWGPMSSSFAVDRLSILKLDGSAGSVVIATDGSAKWAGHAGGDWSPNSAAVVKFATGLRGRSNRGRVFIGPLAESAMTDGVVGLAFQGDLTAAWIAFTNALVGDPSPMPLVVASYRHATVHQVTDLVTRSRVGSQRRRLDQLPL
jgi:hypothetical protein